MKKLIIGFSLGLLSISVNAFDYHGIKSGMTSEEVQTLLKCEYKSSCELGDDDDPEDKLALDAFFGNVKPTGFKKMEFQYTKDDKLWRIVLKFEGPLFGITRSAGFKTALAEKYPDSPLQEESDRTGYFPKTIYSAFLIDSQLFADDIQHFHNEYLKTF
jgi:hypothetical protein